MTLLWAHFVRIHYDETERRVSQFRLRATGTAQTLAEYDPRLRPQNLGTIEADMFYIPFDSPAVFMDAAIGTVAGCHFDQHISVTVGCVIIKCKILLVEPTKGDYKEYKDVDLKCEEVKISKFGLRFNKIEAKLGDYATMEVRPHAESNLAEVLWKSDIPVGETTVEFETKL